MFYEWNWAQGEREYERALALDPSSAAIRAWHAEFLATRGEFDQAIVEMEHARQLDPRSPVITSALGFILSNARRYDESIAVLKQAFAMDPDYTLAQLDLARSYRLKGLGDLAIAESRKMIERGDPLGPSFLAMGYAAAGKRAEAMALVKPMRDEARRSHRGSFPIAMVFAALGDADQAFVWLEEAYKAHDSFLPWINADPEFDRVRVDPRFDALVRRIQP